MQATLRDGWGACASELEVQDLAKDLSNRQPIEFKPQISVLAAEKIFDWFTSIMRSPEGGPLGVVTDSIVKKEYQHRGAILWCIMTIVSCILIVHYILLMSFVLVYVTYCACVVSVVPHVL